MSHLICPLCGLSRPLASFHPTSFDRDICSQSFSGLGKGRGFVATGRSSILHSNVTLSIKDRILDLIELFLKNDLMQKDELERRFGLRSEQEESAALAAILEEKNQTIAQLKEEVSALEASKEETVEAVKGIISLVEERLGSGWIFGCDDPLDEIKHLIEKLMDEIEANRAGMEENADE